jgi:hypothetical protein
MHAYRIIVLRIKPILACIGAFHVIERLVLGWKYIYISKLNFKKLACVKPAILVN